MDDPAPGESHTSDAQDEYRRALRDYTQLMRHRLANPLTTIISGIATLRELPDMEPHTREALLAMMAEHAAQLEQVALYPVAQRPEEEGLVPLAERGFDGPERRAELRDRRKGMNEAQFRRINDLLAELTTTDYGDVIDFVCECSDSTCAGTIQLTIAEYAGVHASGTRFAVEPRHDDSSIEDVVARTRDWWTVEKRGIAGRQAEQMKEVDEDRDPGSASSPPAADS
jgi:hypothetical protein